MIRQLIIPGIIAGALHGGLLLIPSMPAPPPPPTVMIDLDKDKWPALPVVPPDIDPVKSYQSEVARRDIRPAPVMPQTPVAPINDVPTEPLVPDFPQSDMDPNALRAVFSGPTMPGFEGGTGGFAGLIDSKLLDKTPRTVFQMAPDYPSDAKRNNLTGTVTVMFTVDENGNVHNARVAGSTDSVFNEAALRAVSRWRFEPGRLHGKRVAFKMSVPIAFTLSEGE